MAAGFLLVLSGFSSCPRQFERGAVKTACPGDCVILSDCIFSPFVARLGIFCLTLIGKQAARYIDL